MSSRKVHAIDGGHPLTPLPETLIMV
jgi:hypothetical protein